MKHDEKKNNEKVIPEKTEEKISSVKDLKEVDTSSESKPKVSKRELTEDQHLKYLKILADGKPHKIKDLLDEFQLEHTNSGRERLRAANRKIKSTGEAEVVGQYVEGAGKHFVLVANGKIIA